MRFHHLAIIGGVLLFRQAAAKPVRIDFISPVQLQGKRIHQGYCGVILNDAVENRRVRCYARYPGRFGGEVLLECSLDELNKPKYEGKWELHKLGQFVKDVKQHGELLTEGCALSADMGSVAPHFSQVPQLLDAMNVDKHFARWVVKTLRLHTEVRQNTDPDSENVKERYFKSNLQLVFNALHDHNNPRNAIHRAIVEAGGIKYVHEDRVKTILNVANTEGDFFDAFENEYSMNYDGEYGIKACRFVAMLVYTDTEFRERVWSAFKEMAHKTGYLPPVGKHYISKNKSRYVWEHELLYKALFYNPAVVEPNSDADRFLRADFKMFCSPVVAVQDHKNRYYSFHHNTGKMFRYRIPARSIGVPVKRASCSTRFGFQDDEGKQWANRDIIIQWYCKDKDTKRFYKSDILTEHRVVLDKDGIPSNWNRAYTTDHAVQMAQKNAGSLTGYPPVNDGQKAEFKLRLTSKQEDKMSAPATGRTRSRSNSVSSRKRPRKNSLSSLSKQSNKLRRLSKGSVKSYRSRSNKGSASPVAATLYPRQSEEKEEVSVKKADKNHHPLVKEFEKCLDGKAVEDVSGRKGTVIPIRGEFVVQWLKNGVQNPEVRQYDTLRGFLGDVKRFLFDCDKFCQHVYKYTFQEKRSDLSLMDSVLCVLENSQQPKNVRKLTHIMIMGKNVPYLTNKKEVNKSMVKKISDLIHVKRFEGTEFKSETMKALWSGKNPF